MNNNKYKKFYYLLIEISSYLNLRNKYKWVEIGCGNGNFVDFLLKIADRSLTTYLYKNFLKKFEGLL